MLTVDQLYEYVERALRAQIAYIRDKEYVVGPNEKGVMDVVIVDEFTGRLMPGRQWQDGLHQAIQAKERLEITLETITAARVTVQEFFKRYKKLSGMTGTASSDAAELRRTYKVHVFPVPTNRPGRRTWLKDRIFSTEDEKFRAVADEIVRAEQEERAGADRHAVDREVGEAQRPAERGGHRAPDPERQEPRDRGPDRLAGRPAGPGDGGDEHGRPRHRHQARRGRGRPSGGLHVIGTERHESFRIDRQLAGRCARQGDPGQTQFFVSLEDELIEAFGEKPAARLRRRYKGRGELTSPPSAASSSAPRPRRSGSTARTASC